MNNTVFMIQDFQSFEHATHNNLRRTYNRYHFVYFYGILFVKIF